MRFSNFTINVASFLAKCACAAFCSGITFGYCAQPADTTCKFEKSSAAGINSFRVFDGTLYSYKPDLLQYGIEPIAIVDRGIWPEKVSQDEAPDPKLIESIVRRLGDASIPIVLDFEAFPLTGNAETINRSVAQLSRIASMFRAAAPGRSIGFYGDIPIRDYWRAQEGIGNSKYSMWQEENDRVQGLEKKVDIIFPSLYTFYADEAGWTRYARAQICEARRMSTKPVYVFLWPEYHDSNAALRGTQIDAKYWRTQLETARKFADGIVIWGGYDLLKNRPRKWNEEDAWWKETRNFLATN